MKKVNYLNNRDLLAEIHASKNTYCSYVTDEYANFDLIVHDIKKINAKSIAEARKNRAKQMTQQAWEEAKKAGNRRVKMSDFEVSPRKVEKTDLIFRVMTFDHIPLDGERKKNPKSRADHHVKVNFPPFQHFKLDAKGRPKCVGKSHWEGGMTNGSFRCDHGKMTNKLALMYMKLCERYGTRSNWRGYTYNDEMQSQALMQLSQIGLQFDESKSDNPFAYYTAAITNSFTRILNIEKKNQNIRDDILEMEGMMPSYTRQAKNEAEQLEIQQNNADEILAEKQKKRRSKKPIHPPAAPVKVYTKKAIKELNRKMKSGKKLTSEDFEEVK
jgi:hypothetical protein